MFIVRFLICYWIVQQSAYYTLIIINKINIYTLFIFIIIYYYYLLLLYRCNTQFTMQFTRQLTKIFLNCIVKCRIHSYNNKIIKYIYNTIYYYYYLLLYFIIIYYYYTGVFYNSVCNSVFTSLNNSLTAFSL